MEYFTNVHQKIDSEYKTQLQNVENKFKDELKISKEVMDIVTTRQELRDVDEHVVMNQSFLLSTNSFLYQCVQPYLTLKDVMLFSEVNRMALYLLLHLKNQSFHLTIRRSMLPYFVVATTISKHVWSQVTVLTIKNSLASFVHYQFYHQHNHRFQSFMVENFPQLKELHIFFCMDAVSVLFEVPRTVHSLFVSQLVWPIPTFNTNQYHENITHLILKLGKIHINIDHQLQAISFIYPNVKSIQLCINSLNSLSFIYSNVQSVEKMKLKTVRLMLLNCGIPVLAVQTIGKILTRFTSLKSFRLFLKQTNPSNNMFIEHFILWIQNHMKENPFLKEFKLHYLNDQLSRTNTRVIWPPSFITSFHRVFPNAKLQGNKIQ